MKERNLSNIAFLFLFIGIMLLALTFIAKYIMDTLGIIENYSVYFAFIGLTCCGIFGILGLIELNPFKK